MAKIITLKDLNNESLLPRTKASIVSDSNNISVEDRLGTLSNQIQERATIQQISNPNLLINGDFRVNQRGQTSYSGANKYTVDRWKTSALTSFVTVNANNISCGISGATSTGGRIAIHQIIEDYEKFKGKTLTASIKFSNLVEDVSETTILRIDDGVSSTSVKLTNLGIANVTRTIDSDATRLYINVMATSSGMNYSLDIDYIKLELGSIATPFNPRPYAEELAMCQRYYYRWNASGRGNSAYGELAIGYIGGNTYAYYQINLPNELRTSPTLKYSKLADFVVRYNKAVNPVKIPNSITIWTNNKTNVIIRAQFDEDTSLNWMVSTLRPNNTTEAYLELDAEIY